MARVQANPTRVCNLCRRAAAEVIVRAQAQAGITGGPEAVSLLALNFTLRTEGHTSVELMRTPGVN
jgi:hypothetical protein